MSPDGQALTRPEGASSRRWAWLRYADPWHESCVDCRPMGRGAFAALRPLVVAVLLAGCASLPGGGPGPAKSDTGRPPATASKAPPSAPAPAHAPGPPALEASLAAERAERQRLEKEHAALRATVDKQAATGRGLEDQLARLRSLLLAKDAQIELLTQQLDAAILEVVRAMAKLRSLESKAEAASSLAEAEVAVKVAQRETPGRDGATTTQAERLLTLGTEEFKRENYGGALYLGARAKELLKVAPRESSAGAGPTLEGEVAFAVPLRLRPVGNASVREGPGGQFKLLFMAPEGSTLTGQSYKGPWIRVRSQDGRSGWIHSSAAEPR